MFPLIDKKKTGVNLRRLMDERNFHWLNGLSMPTIDNLYALSYLFKVSVDDIVCGNRDRIFAAENDAKIRRMCAYYDKISEIRAA